MDRKSRFAGLAALVCLLIPTTASAQAPKKIAVYPFDDRANTNKSINIGLKVADALVAKLTESGAVTIVDREYLKQVAAEKNLKYDPNFDPSGAARAGLMGVVDALVVGQIDAFHASVAESQTGNVLQKKTKKTGETTLKVTARLISIERGSILAAPTASSELSGVLSTSSTSVLLQGAHDSSTSTNADQGLSKLVDQDVDEVAGKIAKSMAGTIAAIPTPVVARSITAKFVGMDEGSVILNKGTSSGVKVGDKFALIHLVTTNMVDPDTKRPITRHKKVCELTVSQVEEGIATGKCVGEKPQGGDEAVLAP